MAGSELYISEMLEKFEEKMTKSMGSLAASMEGMAESMAISTESIGKVVQNTGMDVSNLVIKPGEMSYVLVDENNEPVSTSGKVTDQVMFEAFVNATGTVNVEYDYEVYAFQTSVGVDVKFMNRSIVKSYTSAGRHTGIFENVPITEKGVLDILTATTHYGNFWLKVYKLIIHYDLKNLLMEGVFADA